MNKKVLIERTEKERDKASLIVSSVFTFIILAVLGIFFISEMLGSNVSCNGLSSCLLKASGEIFSTFILIGIFWYIMFLMYYLLLKWKEVTNKEIKSNSKRRN